MPVTLELPPELEARLRDRAAQQGIDPGALAVRFVRDQLEVTDPTSAPDAKEAALLEQIKPRFSGAFWRRYRELIARREDETLTPAEQQELIGCTDQLEEWNARRMAAVGELARLRGVSFPEMVRELGVGPLRGPDDE